MKTVQLGRLEPPTLGTDPLLYPYNTVTMYLSWKMFKYKEKIFNKE
jgi:hypothetical protein